MEKKKTTLQLANELNEIMIKKNKLVMEIARLDKEYDEIIYELHDRLPNLKDDPNLQPKQRRRKYEQS